MFIVWDIGSKTYHFNVIKQPWNEIIYLFVNTNLVEEARLSYKEVTYTDYESEGSIELKYLGISNTFRVLNLCSTWGQYLAKDKETEE